MVSAIFDNGAGTILTREDVLPSSWLADIQPICVNVKAAGDTSFRIEGILRLLVKIDGHNANAVPETAPKLATKKILGAKLID